MKHHFLLRTILSATVVLTAAGCYDLDELRLLLARETQGRG